MRIRHKTILCLNCSRTLGEIYNYCPNCGQENNNINISFGTLAGEAISTLFAIDGRLAKSIRPFFFKPGYLTNRFNEGKRAAYFHPVRMYVFVSLFYFFVLSIIGTALVQEANFDN